MNSCRRIGGSSDRKRKVLPESDSARSQVPGRTGDPAVGSPGGPRPEWFPGCGCPYASLATKPHRPPSWDPAPNWWDLLYSPRAPDRYDNRTRPSDDPDRSPTGG